MTVGALANTFDDELVRSRFHRDGLLREPVEEFAAVTRRAPVEAERELVKVVVQVSASDGPLMSPEQPALQERDDPDAPAAATPRATPRGPGET